jgi:DNA mismatch repair ATPase MutS
MTDRHVTFTKRGDFYEYRGELAEKIANTLDFSFIRGRGNGEPGCVGFPAHSKDSWALSKLQSFGYTVTFID